MMGTAVPGAASPPPTPMSDGNANIQDEDHSEGGGGARGGGGGGGGGGAPPPPPRNPALVLVLLSRVCEMFMDDLAVAGYSHHTIKP